MLRLPVFVCALLLCAFQFSIRGHFGSSCQQLIWDCEKTHPPTPFLPWRTDYSGKALFRQWVLADILFRGRCCSGPVFIPSCLLRSLSSMQLLLRAGRGWAVAARRRRAANAVGVALSGETWSSRVAASALTQRLLALPLAHKRKRARHTRTYKYATDIQDMC